MLKKSLPLLTLNHWFTKTLLLAVAMCMLAVPVVATVMPLPAFADELVGGAVNPSPAVAPVATPSAPAVPTINAPTTPADLAAWSADPTNVELAAKLVLNAIVNGQWGLLVSLLLTAVLALLRKYIPAHTVVGKWVATRVGLIVTNLLLSLGLGFATAFAAGGEINVAFFVKAISVSVTAAGAWGLYQAISTELSERAAKKAGQAAAEAPKPTLDK